jgi:lipoprotein-anchoring transpeptidase ErfK/SrfK
MNSDEPTTNAEERSSDRAGRVTRRTAIGAMAIGAVGVAAACSTSKDSKPKGPVAHVTYAPAAGATDVPVVGKVSVTVAQGTLNPDVKLTNAQGKVIPGQLSPDRTTYTVSEPLGYGSQYTWSGTATGTDMKVVPVQGGFTAFKPKNLINVVININDDQEVGIAAPLILTFDSHVENKAAVEKALTLTTTPAAEGSWAWLPDDGGSRLHWRSKEYLEPGTKISMTARLYGLDHGSGYGSADMSTAYTIGRSQIVKAEASSHQIVVERGGSVLMTLPCSYGEGDVDRNVTRSGIHVVSEKYEDFWMSNPAAGYFNVHERFAVRISNNGEFIHANPETVGVQGSANVTNGCINLSLDNARQYFQTAIYGDPVEVSGTRIDLSAADGDIYDWAIDWRTWKSMSALGDETSSQTPTPTSQAPASGVKPAG